MENSRARKQTYKSVIVENDLHFKLFFLIDTCLSFKACLRPARVLTLHMRGMIFFLFVTIFIIVAVAKIFTIVNWLSFLIQILILLRFCGVVGCRVKVILGQVDLILTMILKHASTRSIYNILGTFYIGRMWLFLVFL